MKIQEMIYLTTNYFIGDHWARCHITGEMFHVSHGEPIFLIERDDYKPVSLSAAKEMGYVLDAKMMEILIKGNNIFHCITYEELTRQIFGYPESDPESIVDDSDSDLPF